MTRKSGGIRKSIAGQLLKIIFGLYFALAVTVTGVQLTVEYFHVKNSVLKEMRKLPITFGPGISTALWTYNDELLQSILKGMDNIQIVAGVNIRDANGEEVRSVGSVYGADGNAGVFDINGNRVSDGKKEAVFSGLFGHEFPITHTDFDGAVYQIGRGTVYSNSGVVVDRVKYGFMLILINSVIKTLGLWFIFVFFVRKILGKPLGQLAHAVEQVSLENLEDHEIDVHISGENELSVLKNAFDRMLEKLNRQVKEIRNARDELDQKMEAIATLAGGVAHEFNNALMGIMGNIELLKINFSEDGGINKHLEQMKSAGHRMSHLTAQLLAYAEGGKYQPKDLKLDDFVIEAVPILQHNLSPTVKVETVLPKDISHIKADHIQMQMVLSAILANSNEAIEDEGFIRITAENKDVDEDFTKQHPGLEPGYYVCLTIEDDGSGMDEETRKGIFEPFFTTKFQGRGMGMAAVYGIVRNHAGWISVDSELGRGTTVRIYLPAIEVEIEKPKEAKAEVSTGSGTILMVEDEDVVIEVTQAMLEMLGYRVIVAKTGKDAIHIAETFDGQIDLALLDIKLPDINGRNLYPLIMKARSNLKVIAWSGYSIDGPAREILDAGAQDFIQKPFSIATLSEKLKAVLEGNNPKNDPISSKNQMQPYLY